MYEGITPVVPREFVKKLKHIDKGLDCKFDRNQSRFIITQTGKISGQVPLFRVEGDDGGGYRYPDDRDIKAVNDADMHRRGYRNAMREGEIMMEKQNARKTKDVEDTFRELTVDNKIQIANTWTKALRLGKGNSAFRRITPKSSEGFTVNDNRKLNRSTGSDK